MSSLPKYRQVADQLSAEIAAGRLKAGDQIPPERTFAEDLGISRATVRMALRHLAERGMIEARVGQGTFVGAPAIQQQLSTLTGFTEEMERQGRRAGSIVTEATCRAPSAEAALALGLSAGAEVWHITRIRLADGEPVALETTEVVAEGTPDLLRKADFGRMSLYAVLQEQFGLRPATAEQTLAAAAADEAVAVPLGIAIGAPVLRLTRLTRDATGRPFEHVRSFYRGDAFVMKVRLELGEG